MTERMLQRSDAPALVRRLFAHGLAETLCRDATHGCRCQIIGCWDMWSFAKANIVRVSSISEHKYVTQPKDQNIMPKMCNIEDFDPDRDMIRQSLDAMANDIGMAMRDAGLADIPTYLVIPNSGSAIATLMTPLDPSDDDWAHALEIACQVIQTKLSSSKLHTRKMAWTMAN